MAEKRLVPVFPLPEVVFFPKTVLPLHVFETRYREMVQDAMDKDGRIVVALLEPGLATDDGRESPPYLEVATIGRMDGIERTRDGRFHFRLIGEERVRLGATERDRPYRIVHAVSIPEHAVDEDGDAVRRAKLDLLASQGCLVRELSGGDAPGVIFDDRIPFENVVNGTCASLPIEAAQRQRLLELDDLFERHRRASKILDEVLQRVLHLKALRSSDEGASGLN